jgi:ADP-L-glycero-D-manno-heptose 6-epimerase|tara:strand:+ start:93 stop:1049 length:957 start_codon:yes stop_codon:yes gene_type:complete
MILVTGAAGFIGINTILSLNQQGIKDLIVVDHFDLEKKSEKLELFQYYKSLSVNDCETLLKDDGTDIDLVIHLGAITDTTCNDSELLKKLNIDFSKKIWKYCTKNSTPLIYASSAATYGIGNQGFDDDETKISELEPLNKYGKSKNDFDLWAINQPQSPPSWVGLKFFNVYGPYEDNKGKMASVVHWGLRKIYSEKKMNLFKSLHVDFKDGYQTRDFIFVGDVVDIILFFKDNTFNGIYNVGTGNPQPFLVLAETLFDSLEIPRDINYIDMPKALTDIYQYYTSANIDKLRSLGYNKKFTSLKEGIDICKNYFFDTIK